MDPSQIQKLLTSIQEGFSGVSEKITGMMESLTGIPNILGGIGNGFESLKDKAGSAGKAIEQNVTSALKFSSALSNLVGDSRLFFEAISTGSRESVDNLGNINKAATGLISAIAGTSLPVSKSFEIIGESAKSLNNDFGESIQVATRLSTALGFPTLGTTIEKFNKHIQASKQLENGLITLHARSGDLNSTFNLMGADITKLNKVTDEFTTFIGNVGTQTGTLIPKVTEYAQTLLQIPGAYSKIVEGTPQGNISLLSAAMTVARGTTQDFADTFDIMNTQFKTLGQVGKEPLELMSRMYSVSQTLGMPFNYISSQVKKVSEDFKYFGDNTQSTLNILNGLGPALKRSGLGPEGISELVGGLTGAVRDLNIAQKSFLSSKTGGASGLQGGYQIDLLLQQGKMDEVFKKMQDTLMQQFGKIVTLKEAAESPEAAGQLTKQTAFLKQGPFGDLVKTDAQAYKLLEAFKSGAKPSEALNANQKQDMLSNTLSEGSKLQMQQYDKISEISNAVSRITAAVTQNIGREGRQLLKTDNIDELRKSSGLSGKDLTTRTEMRESPDKTIGYALADTIKAGKDAVSNLFKVEPNAESPIQVSQITPIQGTGTIIQKPILNEIPGQQGRDTINSLLMQERHRKAESLGSNQINTQQASAGKDDTLTIVLKNDKDNTSKIIAKVKGDIKRADIDASTVGFDVGNWI